MKSEQVIKKIKEKYFVQGEFCNEYGERYIIFKKKENSFLGIFITGDELDWTMNNRLDYKIVDQKLYFNSTLNNSDFFLNSDEWKKVCEILKLT